MILFPAIDLYEHKAVRLLRGDYENMTVYSTDPVSVAKKMEAQGATHLHVVDLEGAREGTTPNLDIVERAAKETNLFVEIGGGIRTMETVERYLSAGADRVILGTAAVCDGAFLRKAVEKHGEKIAVGADVKDGKIAIRGWLETADVTLEAFLTEMWEIGVRHVICTDISRDGAMRGTNLELYERLSRMPLPAITASGGVSRMEDIVALRRMNLYGAIIGKAYYTGDISLPEALEAAK